MSKDEQSLAKLSPVEPVIFSSFHPYILTQLYVGSLVLHPAMHAFALAWEAGNWGSADTNQALLLALRCTL